MPVIKKVSICCANMEGKIILIECIRSSAGCKNVSRGCFIVNEKFEDFIGKNLCRK